jgi:hypothetical protein
VTPVDLRFGEAKERSCIVVKDVALLFLAKEWRGGDAFDGDFDDLRPNHLVAAEMPATFSGNRPQATSRSASARSSEEKGLSIMTSVLLFAYKRVTALLQVEENADEHACTGRSDDVGGASGGDGTRL